MYHLANYVLVHRHVYLYVICRDEKKRPALRFLYLGRYNETSSKGTRVSNFKNVFCFRFNCGVYFLFSDTLLDDFLLTYPVFMSTSDLCQALLGQYPWIQKHYLKEFSTITFLCESYQKTSFFHMKQKCFINSKVHLMSASLALCRCWSLNQMPPIAPNCVGRKRKGGKLWRGSERSYTWCHSGWLSAKISWGMTSMSSCSWR